MKQFEVKNELERVDGIMDGARHHFRGRTVAGNGDVIDWANPLDELIAKEDQALQEAEARALRVLGLDEVELPALVRERIRQEVWDEFRGYEEAFLEWLFAAGPHPLEVMRRLFAYCKMHRASLLWNMGFRQIGPLLKETHAAAQARCRALFGKTKAGWSKPSGAVEKMRAAQRGNCNRLGGKKLAVFRK